jgi:hypothetical protein
MQERTLFWSLRALTVGGSDGHREWRAEGQSAPADGPVRVHGIRRHLCKAQPRSVRRPSRMPEQPSSTGQASKAGHGSSRNQARAQRTHVARGAGEPSRHGQHEPRVPSVPAQKPSAICDWISDHRSSDQAVSNGEAGCLHVAKVGTRQVRASFSLPA